MTTDPTPPNTKMLAGIGALSVAVLVVLGFFFRSYYFSTMHAEQQRKILGVESIELRNYRAAQAAARRVIDRRLSSLGEGGRESGRESLGMPVPVESGSVDAVEGWNKAPDKIAAEAAQAAVVAGQAAQAAAAAASTDAGQAAQAAAAAASTDAGVTLTGASR